MTMIVYEPLNLAEFIHKYHRGAEKGAQLGSWFSEAFHHITGSPDAAAQKQQVTDFRNQVTTDAVNALAPLVAQPGAVPGAVPGAIPGAASSGLDTFLTANRGLLMAGGAGLVLLMLLKPKKSGGGSSPLEIVMPAPISSKGK